MEIEESVIRPRRITPSEKSIIFHMIGKPNSIIVLLEIRKSQDLGRTSRERQVKPRRKLVNLKIVSYIQTHNKTVIPKIKTKPKKKKKKKKRRRRKEKKRKEAKRKKFGPESISRPSTHRVKALPLGHVEHTGNSVEILLLKPSSLLKIFFRRITAVSTVKPQRRSISSHLHVKNGSPTV